MKVRIYDNGGKTFDQYTVVFTKKVNGEYMFLGMSSNPFHPQGFCQHGFSSIIIDRPKYKHLGKKIKTEDLPKDCQYAVMGHSI